jgi:hypothetical protein
MYDALTPVTTEAAREKARQVQSRLEGGRLPTRTNTRELIFIVNSLSAQLEAANQANQQTRVQLDKLSRLIDDWNELFNSLRRVGLNVWEDVDNGICYQWHDQPLVSGFDSWSAAVETALGKR